MDVFIGLDVGTSKLSAVALDGEGRPLAAAARPNDAGVAGLPPGRDEQSPARIYDAALQVLADLSHALGSEARRVRAVGLTGQMHGILLAGADLRPLSNLITWRDRRADERSSTGRTYLEELIDAAGGGAFAGTGSRPASGYGIATLYHMGRKGGLARGSRHALLVHDWLAATLAGAGPCTDLTDAASTALYDVRARRWDARLCRAAGIATDLLPPVQEAGTTLGPLAATVAAATGLPAEATVHTPLGDNQAAVLASLSEPAGQVLVNVGTGGQVSAVTDSFLRAPDLDVRPFPGGRLMSVGASLCGGAAFAYLGEHYARAVQAIAGARVGADQALSALVELAGHVPPGADGLRLEPYFLGKRSDPARRGSLTGMATGNNTPGHWARAFIEGLVGELAGCYAQMVEAGLGPRGRLVGSGNGMRLNPVMQQAAEAAFGMPLVLPAWQEEAACGAALSAMVGCGALGSFDEASALVRYEGR